MKETNWPLCKYTRSDLEKTLNDKFKEQAAKTDGLIEENFES